MAKAQTSLSSIQAMLLENDVSLLSSNGILINVSAPGKIVLHGEHSVAYGKVAVAASLGLRTRLTLCEVVTPQNQPRTMTIELMALELSHRYNLSDLRAALLNKPIPLMKAASNFNCTKVELIDHDTFMASIVEYLNRTSGSNPLKYNQQISLISFFYIFVGYLASIDINLESLYIKVSTQLTPSSGTGSSASFLVCVAAALLQFVRKKKPPHENISKKGYKALKMQDVDNTCFSKPELNIISRWALAAEKIIHASPLGIDNTISVYGSVVEFRKGCPPKAMTLKCKFRMLLISCNVVRDIRFLVTKVASLYQKHEPIVSAILEAMDRVSQSALKELVAISDLMGEGDIDKYEFLEQLETHYKLLGELADINHSLLASLGVSHKKLDEACTVLHENGLHGKLTGAGGGGYVIALVPPYIDSSVIATIKETLTARGFSTVLTALGDVGLTIH